MDIMAIFESLSQGQQMFYAGLVIGAAGLAAAVILAIMQSIGKRRLDRKLNREYMDGDGR